MSNSKFVIDKIAKLFEQGIVNYRDLSNEIFNIALNEAKEICEEMGSTDVLISLSHCRSHATATAIAVGVAVN